ncbi:MAG: helix-turn-helix domain-containing protein [Pseudomonadota bacterium]
MKHASLKTSPRLQRLLRTLQRAKKPLSTRELRERAQVEATTAAISELRANGARIDCQAKVNERGQRLYYYTLIRSPKET